MGLLDVFGFGGDGADDQAERLRAEEAAREARMQSAIDQVNIMFGVRPGAVTDPNAAQRRLLLDQIAKYQRQVDAGVGAPAGGPEARTPEQRVASLQDQLAALGAAPSNANRFRLAAQNKARRERQYGRSEQDLMRFYRTEADKQKAEAASAIAVDMARRGLTAGSAAIEGARGLNREFSDRIMELRNRADATVSGMRTSDEDARLGLISRIRQGMDVNSAIAGANTALQNSISSASETAKSAPLEGLFGDIKDFYEQRRAWDAYRTAYDDVNSGVKTPGSGSVSTGTVR